MRKMATAAKTMSEAALEKNQQSHRKKKND
jgi:hypothetical protein